MEEASGEAPSMGTLKGMIRKSPDRGISLSMGALFHPRETWYVGGVRIPGTLIDE